MSLITTCPHCATSFRVTPDQLRARAGKVRCGQCSQVFDGFQKLGTLPPPAPDAALPPVEAQQEAPLVPQPETHATVPDSSSVSVTEVPPMPSSNVEVMDAEPAPSASVVEPAVEQPIAAPELPSSEAIITSPAVPEPPPEPALSQQTPAFDMETARTQEPDMTAVPAQPSAVVEEPAAMPDTGHRALSAGAPARTTYSYAVPPLPEIDQYSEAEPPKRRNVLWALAAAVAATVLAVQVLHVYRDELAARYPALKPALVAFCGYASCKVRPLQRPDALKIEASDLQVTDPARPNIIQLTATLRNYSGGEVGYPALDLVLTDNREHALVRRIFPSSEYLVRADAPTVSIAANAEVTVRIDIDIGNLAAAGFRLNLVSDINI